MKDGVEVLGPRQILDRMGIGASSVRRLKAGYNLHWLVRAEGELIVLRRYWARRSLNYVHYEIALLKRLLMRGWPVPAPLAEPFEAGGHVWCAFTYLPGRSQRPRSEAGIREEQRRRGRLLATFHRDSSLCVDLGQREGWVRAEDVIDRGNDGPTLDEVLRVLEGSRPSEAKLLRRYADLARARLDELEARDRPGIIVHGDFAPWNLRYRLGRMTGIMDFDLAHLNHRVADFALSWRGHHDEVIRGYEEVDPLPEVERELITPVWWAWCLAGARDQLIREMDSNLRWVVDHIGRRSALFPPPAFE